MIKRLSSIIKSMLFRDTIVPKVYYSIISISGIINRTFSQIALSLRIPSRRQECLENKERGMRIKQLEKRLRDCRGSFAVSKVNREKRESSSIVFLWSVRFLSVVPIFDINLLFLSFVLAPTDHEKTLLLIEHLFAQER